MAQNIGNLTLGSKIKDSKGNKFIVIGKNHYSSDEVTLLSEYIVCSMQMSPVAQQNTEYPNTEVAYYLNNDYLKTLDNQLSEAIKLTKLPYSDCITPSQYTSKTVNTKAFLLSATEIGVGTTGSHYFQNESVIPYMKNNIYNMSAGFMWLRTEFADLGVSRFYVNHEYNTHSAELNIKYGVRPAFNLNTSVLVSDSVEAGYYTFIFNTPPVIQTIQNMVGNFGSATAIKYIATDSDDTSLTHYISFNNGYSWQKINPTRNSNTYIYSHVFNELGEYSARIKVVDSANNEVTSNLFIISVNATNPIINIISVVDRVITFKASCQTHSITKVEIFVNNKVKETILNGFGFNISYELNRSDLNIGKNAIQIKATSSEGLTGFVNLEANKEVYNLPPVGTKVVINDYEYLITKAVENEHLHTYTLDRNLKESVLIGDKIKIYQDRVKVLCSLSNSESFKDYKEMKLVKIKKLKGQFEGYIEEKYELEGEGRYSTVKLELERFNNNVASEIIELQQYFDYLED